MNIDFIDFVKTRQPNKTIEGEGLKRKKKKKATIRDNTSLKQLLANMKLKEEKKAKEDDKQIRQKQLELFKLLNI